MRLHKWMDIGALGDAAGPEQWPQHVVPLRRKHGWGDNKITCVYNTTTPAILHYNKQIRTEGIRALPNVEATSPKRTGSLGRKDDDHSSAHCFYREHSQGQSPLMVKKMPRREKTLECRFPSRHVYAVYVCIVVCVHKYM